MGRPATSWTSLLNCDRILFPSPAARIMAHTGRLRRAGTGFRAGRLSIVPVGEADEATGRNAEAPVAGRAGGTGAAPAGGRIAAGTRARAVPGPLPGAA